MQKNKSFVPKLGEVYYMRFTGTGSEQQGWRPGVVFQNNVGNAHSPNIIALPMTTSLKKCGQPTHIVIPADSSGLDRDSMVLCENPERMSKDRIGDYITTLSEEEMRRIAFASLLATSAIAFLDDESIIAAREQATELVFAR